MSPTFDGATYQPNRPDDPGSDHDRMAKQYSAVWDHMRLEDDHYGQDGWHTLACIAAFVGASEASVSARLRDFRKPRNGGHLVERRYVSKGLWEYRLTPNTKCAGVIRLIFKWPDNPRGEQSSFADCALPKGHDGPHRYLAAHV